MQSNIVGLTKLKAQLQVAPLRYAVEEKLPKLKQDNGWKGAKRDRLEIIAGILLFCEQQKAKTNIMYKNNLNYLQLKWHLEFLTSNGCLLKHTSGKYATTEKGYRFLELFTQLNETLMEKSI